VDLENLIEAAKNAREQAYAPYSQFRVGAAILTASGKVFTGSNIENASYGLTICAERVAVFHMVHAGEKTPEVLVLVTDTEEPVMPCGACRQVLSEFSNPDLKIVSVPLRGQAKETTLRELLPYQFRLKDLQ